jgi:septal ring factor EnvC (AmiA/AmiB activator)
MGGISNAVIAEKIEGLNNLMQAYVNTSREHRDRTDKRMEEICGDIKELKKRVGVQNGRVGKLEQQRIEDQRAYQRQVAVCGVRDANNAKNPVLWLAGNWKQAAVVVFAALALFLLVPPVAKTLWELITGISIELGI